jgi:type II secretory pathway component GspD/PulD (secretin)
MNLRALESKSKAKILSMPKITTLNGNKADLKVSRTSYYKVSSVNRDGVQNLDYRPIDDGITIELTPWITKHGEVNVTIAPSIKTSEVGDGETPPRVTNRSINTNVSLMDGETIALGGLISSSQGNTRNFVPILGSIPLLGYLFSWRNATTTTQELVIYVTPHILNPEAQSVNLEEEFRSLDRRSGFLKNSDFLKGSKEGAARIEAKTQEPKSANPRVESSAVKSKEPAIVTKPNKTLAPQVPGADKALNSKVMPPAKQDSTRN